MLNMYAATWAERSALSRSSTAGSPIRAALAM
jgi:hypothetical protein